METDAPPSTSLSFPTAGFTNLGDSDAISQMGSIGVARGGKGSMVPQIFGKYNHFVPWKAFLQTK